MSRTVLSRPCRLLERLLLVFVYFSYWTTDHSMALAIPSDDIQNRMQSSGLTTEEENLFSNMVDGIVQNDDKTWYSSKFAPEMDPSVEYPMDLRAVLQLTSLANTGMKVIKVIEDRLKKIDNQERAKMGIHSPQKPRDVTPYHMNTISHSLVLEIKNHDCLKNEKAIVPSNDTMEEQGNTWLGIPDHVKIPFTCPVVYDFDLKKELQNLQKLKTRTRKTRAVGNTTATRVQINITITSEVFDNSLLNIRSHNYLRLTSNLSSAIYETFKNVVGYIDVNDFSFRPGSIISTFHVEIVRASYDQDSIDTALSQLGGTLSPDYTIDPNKTEFAVYVNENAAYSQWTSWTPCSKTCGYGEQSRRRTCDSIAPLACAHFGVAYESRTCYLKYCSKDCPEVFSDGDSGNFSSPMIGGKYPALADCVWRITVDANHTIVAYFKYFDVELDKKCKYDFLAFYDGAVSNPATDNDEELMRFCGNSTPPRAHPNYGYPVNTSGSALTVYFKSDATKEFAGFTVCWYKVLKLEYRVSNVLPQSVAILTIVFNPWSTTKNAMVTVGKATTCPKDVENEDCYFEAKQIVVSRVVSVFANREFPTDKKPLQLFLEHILDENIFPSAYMGRKTCVTWDHTIKSPRFGSWSKKGCYSTFSNLTHTHCTCHHTGIYAVIGDTQGPPKALNLKANTYFSVSVSLLLVLLTVNALSTREKLTTGELFHLFETLVLGLLLIIFLIGAHIPAKKELCGFLAFILYYLVLSQFTWMLLTVLWIQHLLKRYLSEKVKMKFLYFVAGCVIPLVLSGVAAKVDVNQRGNQDNVCWASMVGAGTVWGYGAPIFVMLMINVTISVFLLLTRSEENYDCKNMIRRIVKEIISMFFFLMSWVTGVSVILNDSFWNQHVFCIFLILLGVVNFNFCFERIEQFWIGEEEKEKEPEKDEKDENQQKDELKEEECKEDEIEVQPRMTVKTLKNLNIYKENGVFVIEA